MMSVLTISSFDPSRHLCRADVAHSDSGLVIILKWSKSHQRRDQYELLSLPEIPGHLLCLTQAFRHMVDNIISRSSGPLFMLPTGLSHVVLSAPRLRGILRVLLVSLGYSPSHYTMHSFRRGGASFCYNHGFDLHRIKAHGQWKSDSVWSYIQANSPGRTALPAAMAQAVVTDTT